VFPSMEGLRIESVSCLLPSLVSSFWGLASWSSKEGLLLPSSTSFCEPCSCSRTAYPMGSIMAVVAVLLIHMERKAVTNMKPRSSLEPNRQTHCHSSCLPDIGCPFVPPTWLARTHRAGRTPMIRSTPRAMRLCRFQCSTAMATIRPPTNNMLVSLKYSKQTWGRAGMCLRLWGLLLIPPSLWGTVMTSLQIGIPLGPQNQMEMAFGPPTVDRSQVACSS
ncbi:mCG146185, partial [Mus musculus]